MDHPVYGMYIVFRILYSIDYLCFSVVFYTHDVFQFLSFFYNVHQTVIIIINKINMIGNNRGLPPPSSKWSLFGRSISAKWCGCLKKFPSFKLISIPSTACVHNITLDIHTTDNPINNKTNLTRDESLYLSLWFRSTGKLSLSRYLYNIMRFLHT